MPELSVKILISLAKEDPTISRFLPEISGNKVLNRTFLFNIINSVKPNFFEANMRALIA